MSMVDISACFFFLQRTYYLLSAISRSTDTPSATVPTPEITMERLPLCSRRVQRRGRSALCALRALHSKITDYSHHTDTPQRLFCQKVS